MSLQKPMQWMDHPTPEGVKFSQGEVMIKLITTIDKNDFPHITFISSCQANEPNTLVWGQFSMGMSKENILLHPKETVFIMTGELPFKFIEIKAEYNESRFEGPDIEHFNKLHLLRYNTYVRVSRAFYAKIHSATPVLDLSLTGIAKGMIYNLYGKSGMKTGQIEQRLPYFGQKMFRGPINPKFIAYVDPKDGFPILVPCFQARASESKHIIFPLAQFKGNLEMIPPQAKVAVYGMNLEMSSQMVKGVFLGFEKSRGMTYGRIDIKSVYNGMPPMPGQIYPELWTRPKVSNFTLD